MTTAVTPKIITTSYADVKTPRGSIGNVQQFALPGSQEESKKENFTRRYKWAGNLAQWIIVLSMGLYVFANIAVFAPMYQVDMKATIGTWWGVPKTTNNSKSTGKTVGNPEMVRPTFFFLWCILPVFVSALAMEFLRNFHLRRITSSFVHQMAMFFRRKPRVFGRISPWSYGEWLFLLFLLGGNIAVFIYGFDRRTTKAKENAAKKGKTTIEVNTYLDIIGITLGFNCFYNMAFLFLPATRNCAWMEFLNISYANGIKYHRWLGVLTVLTALAHCIAYYIEWIRKGEWIENSIPCFDCPLDSDKGFHVWFNVFGEIALLCFLLIGFSSMPFVRRRFYEVFYYVHHLFVVGVIFTALHYPSLLWWIFPSFALYLLSRVISNSNSLVPVQVLQFEALPNQIVKVSIARSSDTSGNFQVGQFVYLNVPSISKLQWHAFTIASSPKGNDMNTTFTSFTILLKSLGDWTEKLVEYAHECATNNVKPVMYVDGYYGSSLEMYKDYSTVCLVGGGIGATPLLSILEDMVAELRLQTSDLMSEEPRQKVFFLWTLRELSLLEYIHPLLATIRSLDPREEVFKLQFFLTNQPTEEDLARKLIYQGKNHLVHTQKQDDAIKTRSFSQPLASKTFKSLSFVAIFAVSLLIVCLMWHGGGKIETERHEYLWPLERFVEIMLLFAGASVVYFVIYLEKCMRPSKSSQEFEMSKVIRPSMDHLHLDGLLTAGELLHEYKVVVGHRPDLNTFMKQALEETKDAQEKPIGIFMSGPQGLKDATQLACSDLGTSKFDLHEEEFEL